MRTSPKNQKRLLCFFPVIKSPCQTTNITPGTKDKKVIQGYQTDDTLVIDGKTYYASGITSEDPNYTP